MFRNTTIKGIVSLGVLIAVSCSFFTLPTASNQEISVMISASQGGELTLPDKTILKIPAGGLQSDTQVTLSKVSDGTIPPAGEMTSVGSTYQIDLGSGSLRKPATLEIPFDPTLLPDGSEPGQVFLTYYDETTKEWVYAGGIVDTGRNVVVLDISHASLWRPATWNWAAWIAVLDKLLSVSIVDFVEAVQLLTNDCPQTGNYLQVDSSHARNIVQGCVDVDDSQKPILRIINPKSFFYEIKPVSGGNGYPSPTLLAPGDEVKVEASTSDPSPLIIQAEMTQKSGWYLVIHMVITMLPGANQFGIQPSSVACITERLGDVSDLASAVESLVVGHDGSAAAESLSNFMVDGDAVRRFLTAADDCHFGPAPTWSLEGIKQIGGAVSTIMSSTDYIANYLAGNTSAQVSFSWTPPESTATSADRIAFVSDRDGNQEIYVMEFAGSKVLSISNLTKNLGLGINSVWPLVWSPDGMQIAFRPFLGNNTDIYVINSDGSGLKNLTNDPFDNSFPSWSPDGFHFSFTSNRDLESVFNNEIYVMNSDGSEVTRLTTDQSWKFAISWSPDSKHIAFLDDLASSGISVMNADGSGLKNVLDNLAVIGFFSWSPDSTRIVFSSLNYGIGTVNADGSGLINVVSNSNDNRDPVWSPDGTHIAFKSFDGDDAYVINLIKPDGSNKTVLSYEPFLYHTDCPSCPYLDFKYVWSPDSTRLAFESYRDSNREIYIINIDGSGIINLTNSPASDGNPVWSP